MALALVYVCMYVERGSGSAILLTIIKGLYAAGDVIYIQDLVGLFSSVFLADFSVTSLNAILVL